MEQILKPESGFYYHYKHDNDGDINEYAYEVIGSGCNTENSDQVFVLYRPLYKGSFVFDRGLDYYMRPLDMFMGQVNKEDYKGNRFIKITDPNTLAQLIKIRDEMYGK